MPDIVHLLPDAVANQIAAGEVVQRPASAVKELLENAIDAKASKIHLIVKNAGKSLLQVIDNGIGMTETDARLALERHATSKIEKVEDLFSLNTMGFRGEALPSIAAVSQFELKTKTPNSELGSQIIVEGSKLKSQEACQCQEGSNIYVKNLFFNIPARRNFLKSNTVELKHIVEEFLRIALIHPEVAMRMTNESNEVYNLPKAVFRQRIIHVFGKKYDERLVPVNEETDIVKVSGFVGKPEYARKTRGEQFLFVNNRFIKSAYLNHAIAMAFEELISKDHYPSYFLQMEIDPEKIDINIHPTKTEIKFEEERAIYAIIRTAVREALGKYNIAPSLDFDQDNNLNVPILKKGEAIKIPTIQVDPEFNPFEKERQSNGSRDITHKKDNLIKDWDKLFQTPDIYQQAELQSDDETSSNDFSEVYQCMQLHNKYIISPIKSGFILVDQHAAHQRVLIDQFQTNGQFATQQLLMPEELELSVEDCMILEEVMEEIKVIGFDIRPFGKGHYIIDGKPTVLKDKSSKKVIEELLEDFKNQSLNLKNRQTIDLHQSLARSMSIRSGQRLSPKEMKHLIDELFACEMPYALPNGRTIVVTYSLDDLNKQFKKR